MKIQIKYVVIDGEDESVVAMYDLESDAASYAESQNSDIDEGEAEFYVMEVIYDAQYPDQYFIQSIR